jgi:hypothetical protein
MHFSIARLVQQVMLPVTLVAFMSACQREVSRTPVSFSNYCQ